VTGHGREEEGDGAGTCLWREDIEQECGANEIDLEDAPSRGHGRRQARSKHKSPHWSGGCGDRFQIATRGDVAVAYLDISSEVRCHSRGGTGVDVGKNEVVTVDSQSACHRFSHP
jgi:hypothetical protein